MARDEMAPQATKKRSLLDRRSYLKLAGASVAAVTGLGSSGAVAQDDANYLMHESFTNVDYRNRFTNYWKLGVYDAPATEAARSGDRGLHVSVPAGSHIGMAATVDPAEAGYTDDPPRELYASYWIKFGENFSHPHNFSSKLPGFENHERRGESEPSDGTNGWAARGMFTNGDGGIGLGWYCYHMDQAGRYGDHIEVATVPTGKWHHIEQRMTLNTVSDGNANRNGGLTMWLDGERVYHNDSMAFTLYPENGINYAFQVYYGGNESSPRDNDVYVDDWVLATKRVGHPGPRSGVENADVFLLSAENGADAETYRFTVDGTVQKRYMPSDKSAENYGPNNDGITDNGDGTYTVTGMSSANFADSYYVGGKITDITLNADLWTLYWANEEVTPAELTGANGGSSSDSTTGSIQIDRFEVVKSETLGDDRMFSVRWAVSSSNQELDTVEIVAAKDILNQNFEVIDVSGRNASGWDLFQFPVGTELNVSLRAQDTAGNVAKDTKSITL